MILLAGLTPAWQHTLVFDAFKVGEVNRARESHWNASGKVLNAAVALRLLGGDGLAIAPVGGPAIAAFDRELDELGVSSRWVLTESSTRVCTTIIDRERGTMTELVESGRPLTLGELDAFCDAYAEEAAQAKVAVLTGSLPAGVPDSYYRELMRETPCPVVLDFRGPGLLSVLDLKPLVVKPNREELAQTVGRPLNTNEELRAAMRELHDRGAGWVVVTQGAGPVWVSSAESLHRLYPPPVTDAVSPLGCGDAMAAAIAWSVEQGHEIIEAVRLGIAAAGDNLRHLLPGRVDREAVFRLAEQTQVEKLDF